MSTRGCAPTDRSCGAAAGSRSRGSPSPGGRPSTRISPAASGTSPRIALSSVDFPTPLGPRIATNSRSGTSRSTSRQTVRPPRSTRADRNESAFVGHRSSGCACASAASSARSSRTCHAWNVAFAGVERLGDGRRPGCASARAASTSRCTSGVAFWLLNTNTLISWSRICASTVALSVRGRLVALGDRVEERRRRHQLQAERLGPRRDDALRRADRRSRVAVPDLRDQRRRTRRVPSSRNVARGCARSRRGGVGSTCARSAAIRVDDRRRPTPASTTGADCRRRGRRAARRRRARCGPSRSRRRAAAAPTGRSRCRSRSRAAPTAIVRASLRRRLVVVRIGVGIA